MSPNSSRRPVIGILTADSAPCVGGIGRHVESLSEGLRAAGYDVRVFDVRSLRAHRFGRNIAASLCMGPAVRRWIQREGIGLLHVHGGPGGVLPLGKIGGVPLIVTANHTYEQQSDVPGQAWKAVFVPWERRGYRAADRVVCISPGTRDDLVGRYGIDPAKVSVIECGFDTAPWVAADREPGAREMLRCVFVGRPQARKGWDILASAWKQICGNVPGAMLHVVGFEGVPMDGATYRGRLSDSEVRELIGSSRLLLMPSRVEGFGLAAAEAVCAGTPVVGFDVPGLRSTVEHGRTGLLGAPDGHCFAENAATLLRDADAWTALHEGCRAARPRFGIAAEVAAHEALYAAVYSSV